MKILHVVVGLDPALGGPPAVALRLAAAQASLGHDVTIAGHETSDRRAAIEASRQTVPHIDRVHYVPLDPAIRASWFISASASKAMHGLIAEADIVHLHGLWEPLVRTAATASWAANKPYVLTPHGMLDPWSLQQRRLKKAIALFMVFRRVLNRAAYLHILNDDEAELLKPLGLRTPMKVMPNGVFLEEIEPLPRTGEFRSRHPELEGDPFILFLSRLHYKKGLDYLADAFAQVLKVQPSLRLVVAGPDEGALDLFNEQALALGATSRVHVVGPIWGRDKYAAMVDAACFCLPSRQEGFSMAITEAMACGLPVVISENCHFPEVAEHHAGEVVPLNAGKIADALNRVLSSEHERQQMGSRGRQLVLTRFTWPAIATQSIELYQQITRRG